MMTRAEKEVAVTNVKVLIEKANAVFLTNLIGVKSNDSVQLRKAIREAGGSIVITRNTLFKRASVGTKYEGLFQKLKGTNAIAFSFKDAPVIAKILFEAGKSFDAITFKGGFLGEKEISSKEVEALAKLPSRDQMLATVLATFNAPVSAFVRCLDAIRGQKEEVSS